MSDGKTGGIARDHDHQYEDDVALVRELGLAAYRFSISWSRILSHGTGRVNPAGLAYRDRLLEALPP